MKNDILLIYFLLLFIPFLGDSQIITTIAGDSASGGGYSGDGGPATAAELNKPYCIQLDASGNYYLIDNNNVIRKVNTSGIISTFAGNYYYGKGYSGDGGPATAAELNYLNCIAFDISGNSYITDGGNNVVRKVNTNGIISTVVGNYSLGRTYSGDNGPATNAGLFGPVGIVFDKNGNLYFADDGNNVIRKVNTSGIITTIAGNYSLGRGYSGDGGSATDARLSTPSYLAMDNSDNLYLVDESNMVVRNVNTAGVINTIAGNTKEGYTGDGGPATDAELYFPSGINCDENGNLFIADQANNVIRFVNTSGIISTIAGNHIMGYKGDGGMATDAELSFPSDVIHVSPGVIFITDGDNNVVREVTGLTTGEEHAGDMKYETEVYPNPNRGQFIIEISNEQLAISNRVEVYNMIGEKVFLQLSIVNYKLLIDLSGQPDGVYFYRILNNNGVVLGNGKLIIAK